MRQTSRIARVLLSIGGLLAIAWSLSVFSYFDGEQHLINTADIAIRGEVLTEKAAIAAEAELSAATPHMRSSMFFYGVIISLMSAERAIARGDTDNARSKIADTESLARNALEREPTDSFLWLTLFWLDTRKPGTPSPADYQYLRMSYLSGPNEAWIALKRNSLTWGFFPNVPNDLVEAAASEFVGLVTSFFHHQAAEIAAGPGWPARDILLSRVRDAPEVQRNAFIEALREKRPNEFIGSGLDKAAQRPWR